MESCVHFLLCFLFVLLIRTTSSQSIIKTLPGFSGSLPFKLETGYISVGEYDEKQLFYYFIESEGDPQTDPLLFWITGGPGCSGFSGLAIEIGPLAFDLKSFDGSFPSLVINPYSWTQVASIIFIDSPVGTGFSYSTTSEGYASSDTKIVNDNYLFLRKWLLTHSKFIKNRLYVAGDSYGGKIVPMVALEIAKGNDDGFEPRMALQGYIVGNSVTDRDRYVNERIPYAHRMALISDEYYELAKSACDGEYVNPDPNNYKCIYALRLINECIKPLDDAHILEPKCQFLAPKPYDLLSTRLIMPGDDPVDLLSLSKNGRTWCRNHNYAPTYIWANNETVQKALHIRKGTKINWARCNKSIENDENIQSVLSHHKLLNHKGYQALAYSGDHDLIVPYMNTLKWIRNLNLSVDDDWRPWNVNGQVAGYTMKYRNGEASRAFITFATVKGAGHTAPEYKPKECLAMIQRWLSLYPL